MRATVAVEAEILRATRLREGRRRREPNAAPRMKYEKSSINYLQIWAKIKRKRTE